jgi:hypothetical protein
MPSRWPRKIVVLADNNEQSNLQTTGEEWQQQNSMKR